VNELALFSQKSNLPKSPAFDDGDILDLQIPKKIEKEKTSFISKKMSNFIDKYSFVFVALILSSLAGFLYSIVGFRSLYEVIPFFRLRWFLLGFISLYLGVSFLGSFNGKYTLRESFEIWVNSFLMLMVSFIYYARINFFTNFPVLGLDLSSRMVFIPLTLLIFLINFNLFGKRSRSLVFTAPQILLIALQGFSFISTINTDVTFERDFSVVWLQWLFDVPIFWWLVISAFFISFVSISSLKLKIKDALLYLGLFFVLSLQAILSIYILQITYWYQAILFLIIWDFLFVPVVMIALKKSDLKFMPKLWISSFYHLFLFTLIILFLSFIRF